MRTQLPNQKVSDKEKQKPEWYIPTCDYLISKSIALNNKIEVKRNLDAANGIVDYETYRYVMNPLSSSDNTLQNFPGEIRNVDFITPIKEKNLGEYINLPYVYHVKVNNMDVVMKRTKAVQDEVVRKMQDAFTKMVATKQGEDPNAVIPDISTFAKEFEQNWIDERATEGQHRLNLLNDLLDFNTKRIQAFYYWWATEEVYTHRWLENGEVRSAVINPLDGFPIDNGEQFVEDMDGFVWRRRITFNQFYETYKQEVEPEDIDTVEELFKKYNANEPLVVPVQIFEKRYENASLLNYYNTYASAYGVNVDNSYTSFTNADFTLYVYKLSWKTFQEINFLTYENALGEIIETVVPSDYKLDKSKGDISIREDYVNSAMTIYRFGNQLTGIYSKPKYELIQRRDEKNPNLVKLPFGGKRGLLNGIYINPIPKRVLPYLALYRIYTLQLERTIAKYKGNIQLVPQSMINPDSSGTTEEKFFYMKADNTLVYDDTKVNSNDANAFRIVGDVGLENYISTLYTIIKGIISDAWDLSNMNDERYGNIANSQTVTNANRNAATAKLGSSLMITMFNKAMERDHMADLEYTKVAWIDGKQGSYWNKEKNNFEYVDIKGEDHIESIYGIFVRDSITEESKLNAYKDLSFSAAQNGDFELASESITADSVSEIRKYVKSHSEALKTFEATQNQNNNDAIKYAADKASADVDKQLAHQEKLKQMEIDSKERIADLQLNNQIEEDTTNKDLREERKIALQERAINDIKDKNNKTINIKERELDIKRKQLNTKK